jgi:hypothetical protein
MGISLARNAPADASAAYMSLRYTRAGELQFIQRWHLNTYDAAQVSTEANALIPFLHPLYDDTWLVELTALTRISGSSEFRVVVPVASGGAYIGHVGTSTDTTVGIQALVQTNLTFKTVNNSRARLRFRGISGLDINVDAEINADGSGDAFEKLVNYVVNTSTHIVAHDGSKFTLPCHQTFVQDARERRRSLRVA